MKQGHTIILLMLKFLILRLYTSHLTHILLILFLKLENGENFEVHLIMNLAEFVKSETNFSDTLNRPECLTRRMQSLYSRLKFRPHHLMGVIFNLTTEFELFGV